jgi:nucleoside-diphosphate-sugar epimerase
MKIAVVGGTGRIGSQVVEILNASGHQAVPQSPTTGVGLLSRQGLVGRVTLAAHGDRRTVITDNSAGMFAAASGDTLIAEDGAVGAKTAYRERLAR